MKEKRQPDPKRPAYPPEVEAYVNEEGQDLGIVTRLAVLYATCQPSDREAVVAWLRAHGCPENFIPEADMTQADKAQAFFRTPDAQAARDESVRLFEEGGRQPRLVNPPDR